MRKYKLNLITSDANLGDHNPIITALDLPCVKNFKSSHKIQERPLPSIDWNDLEQILLFKEKASRNLMKIEYEINSI